MNRERDPSQSAEGAILQRIELSNGLTLELYDRSRPVAGDRWRVTLAGRIEIALAPLTVAEPPGRWPGRAELRKVLGDPVVFEQHLERNFIDVREKDHLVGELCDSFRNSLVGYASHPQFAVRFLLREYRRRLDRRPRLRDSEPSR